MYTFIIIIFERGATLSMVTKALRYYDSMALNIPRILAFKHFPLLEIISGKTIHCDSRQVGIPP